VMGTSIAFHLAEAGVGGVVLVERAELASGSTSRAAGGVRMQFSDELNVRIAKRSIEAFEAFGERPGAEIDLRQVGYLFLLSRAEDLETFERGVRLQNELGVPSRMISSAEARELCPLIETGGVLAASFCPRDGHATPEAVVQGYAAGARGHGAHIATRCEVQAIETSGGEVRAVQTSRGRIGTGTVVCAAGAWSAGVGQMAGVELPVTPYRRQVLYTEPLAGLPDALPMTIDFATSFYFHREGRGLLLGMSDAREPPGFELETDDAWLGPLMEAAARRAPSLVGVGVAGGWAGLYEVSPDHNALIGEAPAPSRFLYATGFSGHGFLQGPAVGEIVRDLYLDRAPFVDVAPLSADRFELGGARPEYNIV
jgi:sarcosine oxidase, subunit beta